MAEELSGTLGLIPTGTILDLKSFTQQNSGIVCSPAGRLASGRLLKGLQVPVRAAADLQWRACRPSGR
jgi:hypothetical protein